MAVNSDPATAPRRDDLTFLRRRSRPRPAKPIDYEHHSAAKPIDYQHHASAKPRQAPAPPAAAPAASVAAPAPPGAASSGAASSGAASSGAASSGAASSGAASRPVIDFSRPDRTPATTTPFPTPSPPSPTLSDSLDLSETPPATSRRPPVEPLPRYRGPRVSAGEQLLLGPDRPTVTLTRVQSGVGRLTVQAICSPEIGDLRLGALYQLRSGGTSTVQLAGGNRFGPSSRRPVLIASRDEYEQLAVDLRQIRDIERVSIYAFSESRMPLTWGGTLVITTFGGARVETPLETLAPAGLAVLVSLYNLGGELVVRTEFETIEGDIREAARAYGYDRITWRDDRTPVD